MTERSGFSPKQEREPKFDHPDKEMGDWADEPTQEQSSEPIQEGVTGNTRARRGLVDRLFPYDPEKRKSIKKAAKIGGGVAAGAVLGTTMGTVMGKMVQEAREYDQKETEEAVGRMVMGEHAKVTIKSDKIYTVDQIYHMSGWDSEYNIDQFTAALEKIPSNDHINFRDILYPGMEVEYPIKK